MFTNLIESDSHRQEFKRRSSFFLATVAAYALILSGAGVASIYAYDAHLEAQSTDLTLLSWVPAVKPLAPTVRPRDVQPIHRSAPSNAPVDRNVSESVRTVAVAQTNDPTKVPDNVGTTATNVPPVRGSFHLGDRNVDPPRTGPDTAGNCLTCNGTGPAVRVEETTPPPVPVAVKPPATLKVSQGVLTAKAISLPQPQYPQLAKQIRLQGPVTVQILIDEEGRVISAQTMSGHPMLLAAAKDAALRARFTTTKLSGQAVKVQGLITYNFVLQ
jgi:TonB family protein